MSKEFIKQILPWHIEKENKYAAAKNVWFDKWEPIKENFAPTSPIITSSTAPKTAMSDADTAISKKNIKRKRHPQVVNILKESMAARTITKQILDLEVSLTIGKLLAFALAVEK